MGTKTKPHHQSIDCACLIHGNVYQWFYVDKLYGMLSRNLSRPCRMHVFTEANRSVPAPYIKHDLIDWPGISGPKKSWWYKLQMFDPKHIEGNLLYFDLDTVIVNNIDWICQSSTDFFWTIHDFKRLVKKDYFGINSSIMYWNTTKFSHIWAKSQVEGIKKIAARFRGDQDYIQSVLKPDQIKFFPHDKILSWRWQALKNSSPQPRFKPNVSAGTDITPQASVLVFHGYPKPHELQDPVVQKFWQ